MPPSAVRIGLLGCGVVGQGFLKLLHERERLIRDSLGAPIRVTRMAVRDAGKGRECGIQGIEVGTDPLAVARAEDVDLLVELVCTDDDHLLSLLNDSIRSVDGVLATETFVYLKIAKQTYAWGTR